VDMDSSIAHLVQEQFMSREELERFSMDEMDEQGLGESDEKWNVGDPRTHTWRAQSPSISRAQRLR